MMRPDFTLLNYAASLAEYGDVLVWTLGASLCVGLFTTALAYGFAYAIRFRAGRFGDVLLFVTLITLFGGYLVKIYAWKSILGRDGLVNGALLWLGLIEAPLTIFIYSTMAVVITL